MLINSNNMALAFNGFNAAFNRGYSGAKTAYQTIAMTVPSTSASETYGWLGQFPKMREWIGDRVINSLKAHQYTVVNKKYESTLEVAREDFEDDKFGQFTPMLQEMGRAAAEHPDEMIAALLLSGFTTKCYDGQYFFDADHPVNDALGNEISVANTDGGSGEPWFLFDTSRAVKPLLYQERLPNKLTKLDSDGDDNVFWRDQYIYGVRGRANAGFGLWQLAWGSKQPLNPANYETARVAMQKLRGDENRPLGVRPNLMVVGPSNEGVARKILMSDTLATGETNQWKGTAELLVWPWLE